MKKYLLLSSVLLSTCLLQSCENSDGTLSVPDELQATVPALADIQAALLAENSFGFVPGKTWAGGTMPACTTLSSNISATHELSEPPSYLGFTSSTRVITLATDTVPADADAAITVTYACSTSLYAVTRELIDPALLAFTLNDLDSDGVIDSIEYQHAFAPLTTNNGTYAINLDNVMMYRGAVSEYLVPSAITYAAFAMSPLLDDTTVDTDGDSLFNVDEYNNGTNMYVAASDASFASGTSNAVLNLPEDLVSADFNKDGNLDLAIVSFSDDAVSILLGNGDGTFDAKTDYPTGSGPMGLAVGDMNADGYFDLVVANYQDNTVAVLLNDAAGGFGAPDAYTTAHDAPNQIVLGDFDSDGALDVAVTNFGALSDGTTITVYPGDGDGTLNTDLTFYATGTGPNHITQGDFDNDSDLDLAITNRGSNGDGTSITILLGDGDGTFTAGSSLTTNAGPHGIVTGDLDGDGNLDLAAANTGTDNGSTASVFMGNGDGTFDAKADFTTGTGPFDILALDADGDGDLDLAISSFADGKITIYENNASGTFTAGNSMDASTAGYDFYISTGDYDNDGKLDLASSNFASSTASVFLNE